jgi:adenine deaminase
MLPFVGIQHSLQRGKHSLPDVAAAIKAYTINAAYAFRQEQLLGSIEVGKLADFTIIDQNLFEIPVDKIGKTAVINTIVDGKVVYPEGGGNKVILSSFTAIPAKNGVLLNWDTTGTELEHRGFHIWRAIPDLRRNCG